MKRSLIMLLAVCVVISLTVGMIGTFRSQARGMKVDPVTAPFSQEFSLYYGDNPLESKVKCAINRPYVSARMLYDCFSFDITEAAKQLRWPLRFEPDGEYIALSDAVKLCGIGVMFRDADQSVHLYKLTDPSWMPAAPEPEAKKAYIRLEDITADFGINGRFTHDNLNELRLFGAYLQDHTDAFYIAWIPMYVNPEMGICNDISKDESFYNTDFVFTLDCLADDGGLIGLHGLTHQHAEEISADGFEFGDSIPYTPEELLDRFQQAESICRTLGYSWHFFEFPHYAASELQKQTAEARYEIIYQQYAGTDPGGFIETRTIGEHTCLWVPTPAECVKSRYDADGIISRLTAAHDDGKEISLYFHPAMDSRSMKTEIKGNVMSFCYDEKNGILAKIIRLTDSWGYRFSAIK